MKKGLKRSQVVAKIKRVAQKWENSKIDTNCASTILKSLEDLGIICPPERVVSKAKTPGSNKTKPVYGMEWEPEKPTKIPVKYFVPKTK